MSTRAQILAEIAAQFPDNSTGFITPAKLRQVVEDITNSYNNSTDEGTPAAAVAGHVGPEWLRYASGVEFVVLGDSQSSPDNGMDWPALFGGLRQVSARATVRNFAVSGAPMERFLDSGQTPFETWGDPYKPSSQVPQSWVAIFLGSNDYVGLTAAQMIANWETLAGTARAAGFLVIAYTVPRRDDYYVTPEAEGARVAYNYYLREITTNWYRLVDVDALFSYLDTDWFTGDRTHLSQKARSRLADATVEVLMSQEYIAPKSGTGLSTLADVPTIAWDLASDPIAEVTLRGNHTLANPTNMRPGAEYALIVKTGDGGHSLTFGNAYVGTASITSTENRGDLFRFLSDGRQMICTSKAQDLGIAPTSWVIHDGFSVSGALQGAAPDTVTHYGAVWSGAGWVKGVGGVTRTGIGEALIDSGLSSGIIDTHLIPSVGTSCRVILRYISSTDYTMLDVYNAAAMSIYDIVAGSAVLVVTGGAAMDSVNGNSISVHFWGTTISVYMDGVLVISGTSTRPVTAKTHGLAEAGTWSFFRTRKA